MGILFTKKSYLLAAMAALVSCILMIVFSDIAVMSAKNGITLWTSSVLPAMLPFFICVNFMTGIGLISMLPAGLFPFAMSALSGYPMGAKVVGDMYRSGTVDIHETKRLLSYCSTSGPVFMVGAVGVGMLGSQMAGYVIAVSHYAGAILNGLLYSKVIDGERVRGKSTDIRIEECDLMDTLTISIFSAFKSMAVILAYIIFFMFVMDLSESAGIMNVIESEIARSMFKGFVEMTMGCNGLTGPGQSLRVQCVVASVIISWGGLSILGQSMSMLSGTGISFKYLALTKLTHSTFAGIIAFVIANVML